MRKDLNICHIITTIEIGGAENQLLELAREQKRSGIQVEVIYLKGVPSLCDAFTNFGIQVNSSLVGSNFIKQIFHLKRKKKLRNQVFHAHLPRAEVLCALSLLKNSFVVSRHNSEKFFPSAPNLVSKLLSRYVISRAFGCIAISKSVKEFLISSGEIGPRTFSPVIYYGSSNLYRTLTKSFSSTQGVTIGTIARLVHQKNLPFLLEVFSLLIADESIDWHLNIVGEGPLEPELRSLISLKNLNNKVTLLGKTESVLDFFKDVDVFVLTSNYEGFGLVLLEAMSFGIPVVARNHSAIPEVLGDSHPGLTSPESTEAMSQVIKKIISDAKFRLAIINEQNYQKEKFRISITSDSHRVVYSSLLEELK